MIFKNTICQLLLACLISLFWVTPSYAYLDPGTGSILLQGILASIAVAFGMLRMYWHRFKGFVASITGSRREQPDQSQHEQKTESQTPDNS
jgi:hypothetical protein